MKEKCKTSKTSKMSRTGMKGLALLGERTAAASPAAKPTPASQGVVNLNTASAPQLQLLPGIGPAKAERIAAYRDKHKFRSVGELVRVKGIGRRTLQKLQPYLTLTGPTTLTSKPKPRAER